MDRQGRGDMEVTGRALWVGVALWAVFCVAVVAVRGVQWDETFEHAQVITRATPYPEGHPLFRYCRNAFSLQTYASAAMLKAGFGAGAICGLRNVLLLASTVLPVFLLGSMLSGGVVWGHGAALLALSGAYIEFDSSYPFVIWPGMFSNGPVGGGYALVVLFLLVAGRGRWAALLLGLMPCIHIGQMPPVLGLAGLYAAWLVWRGRGREIVPWAPWFGMGVVLCGAFWLVQRHFHVPASAEGPYAVAGDVAAIWQGYTARDIHRQFPPFNGQIALVGFVLLTAFAAWHEWRGRRCDAARPGPWSGLFLYGAGIAGAVWAIMIAHRLMAPAVPFLLIGWMPYRLVNHIPPLLLVASVAILARPKSRAQWIVGAALVFFLFQIAAVRVLPPSFYYRYLAGGEAALFGLYGAAWVCLVLSCERGRAGWAGLGAAGWLVLAWSHQYGAACVLVGALATAALARKPGAMVLGPARATAAACVLLGALITIGQAVGRNPLPQSEFDRQVVGALAERGDDAAMLVAQPDEFLLQARTGHPVFVETATASLMSYLPEIGPTINQMYDDVYGIRFDRAGATPWRDLWAARDSETWRRLAERYGFRYVVTYDHLELDLPRVFETATGAALYDAGGMG